MILERFKQRREEKEHEKQIIKEFLDSYGIDEKAFNSLVAKAIDNHLDSYVLWRFATLIGDAFCIAFYLALLFGIVISGLCS